MQYRELADFLEHVGKDPSKLIFEDELTGIHNRRFLLSYLKHKVRWDSNDDFPLSLLICLLVKLGDPRTPCLYTQERVGQFGKVFRILTGEG